MFGKLLKNDLKAQFHSIAPLFFTVYIIVFIGELFSLLNDGIAGMIAGLGVVAVMLFACLVIIVAVALNFSKTVFGKAGYLTLTLPVKTGSLVLSKTLSSLIWTYSVYVLFFVFLFSWMYISSQRIGSDLIETADVFFGLLLGESISTMLSSMFYYLAWFGVIMFLVVQCMHFGITCSNVKPLSKFGAFSAIVIFFASFAFIVFVVGKIAKTLPIGMVVYEDIVTLTSNIPKTKNALGDTANGFGFVGPLLTLAASVGLHFPITYLIKHKVNVK